MSLKPLIKNQRITIDDHHWGAGEIKQLDNILKDVHLEKKQLKGKYADVKIKIPINSHRDLTIESGNSKDIPERLIKEIRDALNNYEYLLPFIADLSYVLRKYQSIFSNRQKVVNALKRISKHFDLNWPDDEIEVHYKQSQKIKKKERYLKKVTDNTGKSFNIIMDEKRITIEDTMNKPN